MKNNAARERFPVRCRDGVHTVSTTDREQCIIHNLGEKHIFAETNSQQSK